MSDKMRNEFEAWAIADAATQGVHISPKRNGDWYFEEETQYMNTAWAAWQASRSAVVIELPSADEFDVPSFAHDAIVGCWNAIEAAGLKVKS